MIRTTSALATRYVPAEKSSLSGLRAAIGRVGVASILAPLAVPLATPAYAVADLTKVVEFHLPSQPLDDALLEFSRQSRVQVVASMESIHQVRSPEVEGLLPPTVALSRLLVGSAMHFETVGRTIALIHDSPEVARALFSRTTDAAEADSRVPISDIKTTNAGGELSYGRSSALDEVLVTAEKRTENLLDVPTSISAISGARLEALQIQSLSDLASYVPGLSVTGYGAPGSRVAVIRGLSSDYNGGSAGALVGTYIDDIPVGASTGSARGSIFGVDLVPYDIEDIEVLEGPQGTLYGSNSMGGLIKYTLRKPDLEQIDARAGTYVQDTANSKSPDWGARGAASFPLVRDHLGFRVSVFHQTNAGWISNVGTGIGDANHSIQKGGRAALLWQPTENLTLESTVLVQDTAQDDTTSVTINPITRKPIYGPYAKSTSFPESFSQKTRNYALTLNWNLGFMSITSATGWSKLQTAIQEDLTIPYGAYVPDHPDALTLYRFSDHLSKFVQEVRLSSPDDQKISWMLGGFFTREYGGEDATWPSYTPSYQLLPDADSVFTLAGQVDVYKESAAFANATYHVTNRFDVGGGARRSNYSEDNFPGFYGGLFGNGEQPRLSLPSQGVTTWMGNVRFHVDVDSILYGRVSTGYRPGAYVGPNAVVPEAPEIIRSDKTTNYEIGFKGAFLEKKLQLTTSLFAINWDDIQITALSSTGFAYPSNAGRAKSTGLELAGIYQLMEGLRIHSSLSYANARLVQDARGVGGLNGDQLPISPRWTGSLTVDYQRAIGQGRSVVLGGGYRYRDMIVNQFSEATEVGSLPSRPQNIVDLHAGLDIRKVSLRIYGKNIFNNRSFTGLMYVNNPEMAKFVPIQPRTVGLSVDYQL